MLGRKSMNDTAKVEYGMMHRNTRRLRGLPRARQNVQAVATTCRIVFTSVYATRCPYQHERWPNTSQRLKIESSDVAFSSKQRGW